jgi:hypothetical protein
MATELPEGQEATTGTEHTDGRDSSGRFKPGHSGNPGGRPKMPAELREAMQCLADTAAKVLEDCLTSDDERVRLAAAQQIFDRGYGKPNQSVDLKATVNSADIIKAGHERARALRGGKPVAGADIARNDADDLATTRDPAHE